MKVTDMAKNLKVIVLSGETKEFLKKVPADIGKFLLFGDVQSGIEDTAEYISSIKDINFWEQISMWLKDSYGVEEIPANLSNKFSEDNENFEKYTERQIETVMNLGQSQKIKYYADLTRAWLMGFIKTDMYFKFSNLLERLILEELEYLKEHIDKNISSFDYYISQFLKYGLVEIKDQEVNESITYIYSDLARKFVSYCLNYEKETGNDAKIGLSDIKVLEPSISMYWDEL